MRKVLRAAGRNVSVKIGPQTNPSSAISAANDTTILVRGRDLVQELVGSVSFTDHFWLLVTGQPPSVGQRRVLDATLVAIAEHGLVPSVQASRMTLAAAPEALQGAVAAGILGCGSVVLGSSEAAGVFYSDIVRCSEEGAGVEDAAIKVIEEYRRSRRAIPGYGHPLHKDADPRAVRLLQIAEEVGLAGKFVTLARLVESWLPRILSKPLALNVSGAIPAVLLDAGFPLQALKGVPILARTAGLIAHLLEEQQQPIGFVMSHAAAGAIDYNGPAPAGFKRSDE
jgi:citrate synthase